MSGRSPLPRPPSFFARFHELYLLLYHLAAKLGVHFSFHYLYSFQDPRAPGLRVAESGRITVVREDAPGGGDEQVLHVREDGKEAGMVWLSRELHTMPRVGGTPDLNGTHVCNLSVRKEMRSRGYGRRLVSEATRSVTQGDIYALIACTNIPSRGLFESCGFRIVCPIISIGAFGVMLRNRGAKRYIRR